jgi:molecular chaperone HscB
MTMRPFEILNLEAAYSLDLEILENHYFAAQKKAHPDQVSQGTPQEKAEALKWSTTVNQAYLTLKDPLTRAEYLLNAAGIETVSHDPDFLEQVMGWNEHLARGEDIGTELRATEQALFKDLEQAFAVKNYEKASRTLYGLKYIRKLLKQNDF